MEAGSPFHPSRLQQSEPDESLRSSTLQVSKRGDFGSPEGTLTTDSNGSRVLTGRQPWRDRLLAGASTSQMVVRADNWLRKL